MRLAVFSDVHLEFSELSPYFVREHVRDFDAVINAGDTHPWEALRRAWSGVVDHRKYVEVLGNHDFYRSPFPMPGQHQKLTEVGDHVIASCTLWTKLDPDDWYEYTHTLVDARHIEDITYEKYAACHASDLKFLIESEADVFVTHHGPSFKGAGRFAGQSSNKFFYSDLEETILSLPKPPKLWVYGHSHVAVDYYIGETRVMSNPRGYPNEDTYRNFKIVEVSI